MSERPGASLATRLRRSIEQRLSDRRKREEDHRRREERARAARVELLADIAAFGEAVGHFDVSATDKAVALRFDGKILRFEADGPADRVRVVAEGLEGEHVLTMQETLGRWTLRSEVKARPEQVRFLFDTGLEELVTRVFGLRPSDPDAGPTPKNP